MRPRAFAAALALAGAAAAQDGLPPALRVDAAIAAAPHRGRVPALAWFVETWLPRHARFPADLAPHDALQLTWQDGRLRVQPLAAPLPTDVVAAGALSLAAAAPALWRCAVDGTEDWYVPADFDLPTAWRDRLGALALTALDRPRTLATGVLVGHCAGGLADGDPRRDLLQSGATACGDITWLAWRSRDVLRVRGRSDGGLALPAALLLLAGTGGAASDALAVRAYAARDAERADAARQLGRRGDPAGLPALRAMLFADEESRLAAIDALVRTGAAGELPAIVAAAEPDLRAATLGALDALQLLWPGADAGARQRTRAAIQQSRNPELRAVDLAALTPAGPARTTDDTAPPRLRALIYLAVLSLALIVALARERARARRRSADGMP